MACIHQMALPFRVCRLRMDIKSQNLVASVWMICVVLKQAELVHCHSYHCK